MKQRRCTNCGRQFFVMFRRAKAICARCERGESLDRTEIAETFAKDAIDTFERNEREDAAGQLAFEIREAIDALMAGEHRAQLAQIRNYIQDVSIGIPSWPWKKVNHG